MSNTIPEIIFGQVFDRVLDTVSKSSVPVAAGKEEAVAKAVTNEIAPIVVNASNSEPWYKSRIFIGLGVSAIGFIAGKLGYVVDGATANTIIEIVTQVVQGLGLLYATYGRIVGSSKKPLGG